MHRNLRSALTGSGVHFPEPYNLTDALVGFYAGAAGWQPAGVDGRTSDSTGF